MIMHEINVLSSLFRTRVISVGLGLVVPCVSTSIRTSMYRAQNWLRSSLVLAFDLSDAQGIKHVLQCHPPVASLHATDEDDQLSQKETSAASPTPTTTMVDDQRIHNLELAVQRQLLDGKALKKTRPW